MRLHNGRQPWCRFGCVTFESAHHIFTQCPRFEELRRNSTQNLYKSVAITLESFRSSLHHHPHFGTLLDSLFADGRVWPSTASVYYMGLVPQVANFLNNTSLKHLTPLQHQRLLRRLANDCHAISIRLAGRIWGIVRRSFSPYQTNPSATQQKTVHLPPILSHITSSPASRLSILHLPA
jgi:hypothetical protein